MKWSSNNFLALVWPPALAQLIHDDHFDIILARHLGPELSGRLTSPYAIATLTRLYLFGFGYVVSP